ncbi:type IX secretion system motor protein PorM/GldM [Carboxylicivirga linearis]|uniref:Gliding motility protein GldM n=1 Tax=Carboxylicivirga linearis TaxID=1628157 RepID=A0ABS5JV43_9BACT|nr:gliding motility protein GldM [Carboxylicivirga linearis]MBS2098201.1 gliding motility protein GldM [Carboxylicivirga linearis]
MSGGNCPETPRQKMIGMMYLFLTAMLALNVSGELLQAFQLVDESIQQSTKAVDNKNNQLYAAFEAAEFANPAKVKESHEKAKQVKTAADSLYNRIHELKLLMMHTADKNPEATLENYKGIENQDIAAQIMITEKGGERSKKLKEEITEYEKLLLSFVDSKDTVLLRTLSNSLSTDDVEEKKKGEVTKKPWESQLFEHLPLSASFALLSSIQSNVRSTQADVVSYLLSKVDEGSYKFNKVEPIVIPRSDVVIKGGEYYAEMLIAATDTLQPPTYSLEGYTAEVLENGRGVLRIPANSLGNKKWKGNIVFKDPNGVEKYYPISHEYEVIQPNVVISPTKMNVFYEALENPVEISVPGVASSQLRVSMTNANYRPRGGEYIVTPKPGSVGKKSIITVSAEINGQTRRLGSQEFRIKQVPNPTATVANLGDGDKIRKNLLLAAGYVVAEMGEDFDFDLKFKVTQFVVGATRKGFYSGLTSKSNKFTDEQIALIESLSRGSKVLIEDIRAVGPDGRPRKLGSINFTLD